MTINASFLCFLEELVKHTLQIGVVPDSVWHVDELIFTKAGQSPEQQMPPSQRLGVRKKINTDGRHTIRNKPYWCNLK